MVTDEKKISDAKEHLAKYIDKFESSGAFGADFKFRPGQKEVILEVLVCYVTKSHGTIILDSPTGSGKSVIAMSIGWILSALGKSGYIVASDLMLQEQYQKDFNNFNLKWGNIKGMDNYLCHVNNEVFSHGHCRSRGMKHKQAKELPCYSQCGYYSARNQAMSAPMTLMNYSYWLLQLNYVLPRLHEYAPFQMRDFSIFDEAHKIDDLVQGHFEVQIRADLFSKHLDFARSFANNEKTQLRGSENLLEVSKLKLIHQQMLLAGDNTGEHKRLLEKLKAELDYYNFAKNMMEEQIEKKFGAAELPLHWKDAVKSFDRIHDVYCKVEDYLEDIEDTGIDSIVPIQQDKDVVYKTAAERSLIRKHLIRKSKFRIFMSATIGDPAQYSDVMGIQDAKVIQLPSNFDYEKSKIYQMGNIRLSFRNKAENLPYAVANADICMERFHPNQRGIIHTGSYEFARYLLDHSRFSDRLIQYRGSAEKDAAIEELAKSENGILVGPSILEGLNLTDDLCRFQIFMKVSYPHLGDPLVKRKLAIDDGWYKWKTINNFLQGIGRGVRHKQDWCVTYLVDGCFHDIIWKPEIPKYVSERIVNVKL